MSDSSTLTARIIGGREILFRELAVGAARQMFGSASDDLFGGLLFPQCSLTDIQQMTNLGAEDIEGMRPSDLREVIKTIEKPLRQVNAFCNMDSYLEGLEKATASARLRVRDLGDELTRTENPSEKLQNSCRVAVAERKKLERQEAVHISRLLGMRQELQDAGLDTTDLAREQARLSSALSKSLGAGRTRPVLVSVR